MHSHALTHLSRALHERQLSSVELTQYLLARIDKQDALLNSFITVTAEQALAQAQEADRRLQTGQAHTLTGIPIAFKDIFCTSGIKTSCGSRMLDNFLAPYNATVVEKCRAAGMVMLGKTNMDEFAMGSSGESSFYSPARNPWATEAVPGGSSSGSAAAVAARFVPAALGSDTGGSIRQPAAFCGITGLKPTYGRISRYGMIAFASSLDQGGPMGISAEDVALLLGVIAGHDPHDATSINQPVEDYSAELQTSLKGLKIGLPQEYFSDGLDTDTAQRVQAAIQELTSAGAQIVDISLPHTHLAVPAYYIIAPAECSSNLSRFDGVRFGYRCDDPQDLMDLYTRSREEGFGNEVKRRILIGTYALSAGYYDAYYLKAQKVRRLISQDFHNAFELVDVIAGPTTPTPAFNLGEKTNDPVTMYLSDIYTIAVNLAGLPALSVPVGFVNQRPVGLHLIGRHFSESRLLNIAHQYQQRTHWHLQSPPEFT